MVPSTKLERIAAQDWWRPARLIRNGIDLDRYTVSQGSAVGTLAGLRAVKNLPLLVRAFSRSGLDGTLIIAGEGPERDAILAEARAQGIADRLVLPGHLDPSEAVGRFGIFALSSDSEQQPISLIEAMAAGLPVVATDVGDVRSMVGEGNQPFIVPAGDADRFANALRTLAQDTALRQRIGTENRDKALQYFDESSMIESYRALYAEAVGRSGALS